MDCVQVCICICMCVCAGVCSATGNRDDEDYRNNGRDSDCNEACEKEMFLGKKSCCIVVGTKRYMI